RQIKIGRVAGETVTIKAPRRDADNGHGFRVHPESAAYNRSTAEIIALPRCIAYYCDRGRACKVIGIKEEAPGLRLQAEGAEVVAGHELSVHRARSLSIAFTSDNDGPKAKTRLHRSQFLEFGNIFLQREVSFGWE